MSFLHCEKTPKNNMNARFHLQSVFTGTSERTFSAAPLGSLTIEASLALPIFLFFTVCIIYFLLLISVQNDIQLHIDEAAREVTKREYLAEIGEAASMANTSSLLLKAQIIDDHLRERLDLSAIQGGSAGMHTFDSSYDKETGVLRAVVNYDFIFPYIPSSIGRRRFSQQCVCRAWIGESLDDKSSSSGEDEEQIVYITPYGSVYHLSKECPVLDLSIRAVNRSEVGLLRSSDGSIYKECSCVAEGSVVYITDYGVLYHSSLDCPSLKRTVLAVGISKAGGRKACSRCGG